MSVVSSTSYCHVQDGVLTFGIAYTKEPSGAEEADSGVAVVRKSSRFGPLSVSWRCMFVCGAFGSGKETSIGACDASPLVTAAAIVGVEGECKVRSTMSWWGNIANHQTAGHRTRITSIKRHTPESHDIKLIAIIYKAVHLNLTEKSNSTHRTAGHRREGRNAAKSRS
jgi:hypothetical protein